MRSQLLICALAGALLSSLIPATSLAREIPDAAASVSPQVSNAALRRRLDLLEAKFEFEVKAAEKSVEGIAKSTDRAFNVLYVFGAIGSFLGAIFIFMTVLRERQQHRDYTHERSFYEAKVFRKEQNDIGPQKKSDDLLDQQIEGIAKLGNVIDLVERTFQMQLQREKDQKDQLDVVKRLANTLNAINAHHEAQYSEVSTLLQTFRKHSRMQWTRLSSQEKTIATRARGIFSGIPPFVLEQQKQKDKFAFCRNCQLLGVSAYYANDINAAAKFLQQALKGYESGDVPRDEVLPQAFCHHFLGILEKNWKPEHRSHEENLHVAMEHLEKATDLLDFRESEFLTPITLVEVKSYIESKRKDAVALLEDKISLLHKLREHEDGLDNNQKALLVRAYLLRGNLAFMRNKHSDARKYYIKAVEESASGHFPLLSLARVETDQEERQRFLSEGLEKLLNSGALAKDEYTIRAIGLVEAASASAALGKREETSKYRDELVRLGRDIRVIAGREPMFFDPISKVNVNFTRLCDQLDQAIKTEQTRS